MARPAIKKLSLSEVEHIAFSLAQELMEYGEPIPPFDTRYPDKMETKGWQSLRYTTSSI